MIGSEIALVVDIVAGHRQIEHVAVAIDRGLAGLRQHDEFVAEIAADRAGLGAHRDRLQSHPREGAQIGDEHPVVGAPGGGLVDVEGIGVLHQEFAAAHDAETRTLLVAEFPLDVVEIERQALVGFDVGAEDLGDHFLVGRPVQQLALVPVGDAQHFRAVGVVAAALAPEVGKLQRRHQQFQRAGAVLLLADDLLDLLQHPQAQRQPGIDARRLLPHHAGAQHQPMRDDLGLFRILFQDGQKEPRQSHGHTRVESVRHGKPAVKPDRVRKHKGGDEENPLSLRISCRFTNDFEGANKARWVTKRRSGEKIPSRRRHFEVVFQRDLPERRDGLDAQVPAARLAGSAHRPTCQ